MEAFIAKVISGFLRAETISTMARCSYTYSVQKFREKLFETCQRLPSEKLGRIYTVISTWEPENVAQTEDGSECNFFHLGVRTLRRISTLLGVFNLQERTKHPMTHVQPDFHPPSSLAPLQFLTIYGPVLSPLPPTPQSSPAHSQQPPSPPAHPQQPPSPPAHPQQPPSPPAHPQQPPSPPAHPQQPPSPPAHPQQPPSPPAHPQQPPSPPAHPQQPPSPPAHPQQPPLRVVFRRVDANNYCCVLKDARLIEKSKASKKRKLDDEEDENSKENKRPKN
ncbi:unnamed protein product [Larinioides sclopetarius]|uniref:Uncharacterized protein n=1 Tax=Larinioides sclopetarius TaxID=280406 RepID=A0AAV2B6P8_9ARAC